MALYDGKCLLRIAQLKTGSAGSRNFFFDVTLLAAKAEESKNLGLCISFCVKNYYKDKQHVNKFASFKIALYLRKLINAPARSLLMMKPMTWL